VDKTIYAIIAEIELKNNIPSIMIPILALNRL